MFCKQLACRRPAYRSHPRAVLRNRPLYPRRAAVEASINANDLTVTNLIPPVEVYFCDVDGTLLNSKHGIQPRNVSAVKKLIDETSILFIPATGRSREGTLNGFGELGDVLREMYPNGVPGVYLQGLCVYNMDGSMLHESTIPVEHCRRIVEVGDRLNVDLIAYGGEGDTIFTSIRTPETDKVADYREPLPIAKGSWDAVIDSEPIHKFIYMAPEERILEIRPDVEAELSSDCEITRASEGMLEVLPQGASKGRGVRKLLRQLNISPEAALACGDGENDVEMLQICKHSVAMANAVDAAKKAAKYITATNDEDGVADVIERLILHTASQRV